jgi:glycosyltransferase involved in cell wall biosynthesis
MPYASLSATLRALAVLGLDCLPAYLLQRLSADGALPAIAPGRSLDEQFPMCSFGLCEDMGVRSPVWKTKYPLAKVTEGFGIERGNHWPPTPTSLAQAPVRGIVHHLKWRAALLEAFELERGTTSNSDEMASYRQWLLSHDGKLPTAPAWPCSREALIRRGLLVKPDRRHLRLASIVRSRRAPALTEERQARLDRKLHRLLGSEYARPAAPGAKSTPRGVRACLVTFDLAPPLTSGGIGTAMHALAEQLVAAGHVVDILFCPYEGEAALWRLWHDYWKNCGVKLHYLPRTEGEPPRFLAHGDFLAKITGFLERHRFDLVHAADAAGYAAWLAILRAAGLAFAETRLIVTAHGGTAWHRRGNQLAQTEDEALAAFAERQMLRLADVICCPSDYIRQRLLSHGQATPGQVIVLPNALSSQTRSFGVADGAVRPVDELVMMGRIEPRKGVERFINAVLRLAAAGVTGFGVTFLGRPGPGIELEAIRAKLGAIGGRTRFITSYDHVEAVNYVKTHDCLVVIPSLRENLPYSLYECLENRVPVIASDAGGMPELVAEEDRARILVAADQDRLVAALQEALEHGMRPAALAFEPSLIGLELAALHERLAADAPDQESQPPHASALGEIIPYGDAAGVRDWVFEANRRAGERDDDVLGFCHRPVHPHGDALSAMARLMAPAWVDAVVVGYQVAGEGAGASVMAPGGPAQQAASRNLFGAGLFLIRRSWFIRLSGFAAGLPSSALAHRELLDRLTAAGGEIIGIPRALATVDQETARILAGAIDPGRNDGRKEDHDRL